MKTNKRNHKLVSNAEITTPRYLLKSRKTKPSYNFRAIAILALLFFIITSSAFRLQAQEVNMSRYITLTVENGEDIELDLWADADNTPIKIVSGNKEYELTVDANWIGYNDYTAGANTMTIYGNLEEFDCNENWANITGIDVSNNTELTTLLCYSNQISSLDVSQNTKLVNLSCRNNQLSSLDVSQNTELKELYCFKNPFTTEAIDDLFCSLPNREEADNAKIYILNNVSDENYEAVLASNKQNATDKNWNVYYLDNYSGPLHDEEVPTTGTYECGGGNGEVNMDRYITLNVQNGEDIRLDLWADADNTPVKIVSGSQTYELTVGADWSDFTNYTAGANTMTIYGNILKLDCSGNVSKITGLDPSHNTEIKDFYCQNNQLSSLDVSQNTKLTLLDCAYNQLSSLDVSQSTGLEKLVCDNNQLSTLDVSHNTELTNLLCYSNQISSLDVSQNTQLKILWCFGNPFTTEAVDEIFCSLPNRDIADDARIYILHDENDDNHADVLATNKQNATDKNWKVQYLDSDTDIPATTGTYECGGGSGVNMSRYITLTVENGEDIRLALWADAANTPIKIVSGDNEYDITVDTDWTYYTDYTASAEEMTIYGNIIGFHCHDNGSKITGIDVNHNTELTNLLCYSNQISSLDVSQNTQLKILWCFGNPFTTEAVDALFCSLPHREEADEAKIYILKDDSDPNFANVLATNKQNAIDKKWKVLFAVSEVDIDIPETTGDYQCPISTSEVYLSDLILYPNPVTDGFTIETQERGILEIYSVTGQKVGNVQITNNKQFIDVSNLQSGVYFAKINGRVVKFAKR